jgi:hypothetical protein
MTCLAGRSTGSKMSPYKSNDRGEHRNQSEILPRTATFYLCGGYIH